MLSTGPMRYSMPIAIIGGGPAGLFLAERLSARGRSVDLFDRMPSVGRKFLLAGRGGLNLTHSEPLPAFRTRYGARAETVGRWLDRFSPSDLQAWAHGLGIETFIGTSGRVFPTDFKAAPLLRAWVARLRAQGVRLHMRHRLTGIDGSADRATGFTLAFETPDGPARTGPFAAVALALGGGSWPTMGSDGAWTGWLAGLGVAVAPLRASNCGLTVPWSAHLIEKHAGAALKSLTLSFGAPGAVQTVPGEIILTEYGIEGTPVYALSGPIREALATSPMTSPAVTATIDLRPALTTEAIAARIAGQPPALSLSTRLKRALGLPPAAIALLREAVCGGSPTRPSGVAGDLPSDPLTLAGRIKALPVTITGTRPLAEAISSAGGVRFDGLGDDLMLAAHPGIFCAGEMLDWEAPTGGYLLQGCFASAACAADGILDWLNKGAV